jgi:DNA primase catalytic core
MTTGVIDLIKDKLSILQVIEATGGATIHKNGNGYEGKHLAHESTSGTSLKVDDKNNVYHCWNCGQKGDIFRWVGHREYGDSYRNEGGMFAYALRECARLAGVQLEDKEVDIEAEAERRNLEDIFSLAADYFHSMLPDDLREWLHTRYGLTDETIDKLKIGFAASNGGHLINHLRKAGVNNEDIVKTGLVLRFANDQMMDLFQGRLMFPYWRRGLPVYFIGRKTDYTPQNEYEEQKYKKQMVHNKKHPYVSEQVRNDYFFAEDTAVGADALFVTEGVTDCIIANQHGFPCISPVTVRFRDADHPKLLELTKRATTIYIVNDNEDNEAGRKGAVATAEALWKAGKTARFVELPRPEGVDKIDLNDFLKEQGAEALQSLLPQSRTLLDIYIDTANTAPDGAPKSQMMRLVFGLIAAIDDPFIVSPWRASIPKRLGITKADYDTFLEVAKKAALAEKHHPAQTSQSPEDGTWPYAVEAGRIVYQYVEDSEYGDGEIKSYPLCNFDARIVADVLHDDGEEIALHMAITGSLANGTALPEIDIKADEYEKMQWVVGQWGARAAIVARDQARGQLRHAIQVLSEEELEQRHVYTHTGWRVIDGKRVFLHAGGALGMDGIQTQLPHDLRGYVLPADDAIDPVTAMRESIALLDVAPSHITYPLWASVYLAPLASIILPPFVIATEGESGSKKSSINALMLNHFGASFSEYNTPADWTGTANSLERLCFHAKDVPLLIDDLKPSISKHENQQMMAAVQRIYRAVGNRHGKSRLTGESEFKRTFLPRGVVMSTAERGVMGKSTVARGLTIYIENGDINLAKLTEGQRNRHVYGYAMVGFLRFMSENWDVLERDLPDEVLDERSTNGDVGAHGRLPHAMATLYVAFDLAIQYSLEIGAIAKSEYERRVTECRKVLRQIAAEQSALVEEQDPALIFVQTLTTLLRQGKIKFVTKPTPTDAHEAGYGAPVGEYNGWHDDQYLYVLPSAYNFVCRYVSNEGWSFPSDEPTLRKELGRAGYIGAAQEGRNTVPRRDQTGKLQRVVVIDKAKFMATAAGMGIDEGDLRYHIRKPEEPGFEGKCPEPNWGDK